MPRVRELARCVPADEVRRRLEVVRARIASAGRDPSQVTVVAVTKGFETAAVSAAVSAGITEIGENYAQELIEKASSPAATVPFPHGAQGAGRVHWHYLGQIQRRKVRDLAGFVDVWETVSRLEEASAIARRSPRARAMIEVETTGLATRNGCEPSEVPALAAAVRELGLDLVGLMTVAPPGDPDAARRAFRQTAQLAAALGLAELSMGMTDDLETAVEEGATMVRVGRALFGERLPDGQRT